jgi:SAM-dependent methyltransferase
MPSPGRTPPAGRTPLTGRTLIDIGAGFGRLADEYDAYERIVLFDYSRSLLREAQAHLAGDPRFYFVAGNWYEMPFVSGLFDTLVQIRTIHHAADVPALFRQLARIARPGGHYILEFANKHNLKAMLRYRLGRQDWSPFIPEPVEFAEMNFDFHPRWMRRHLQEAGFLPGRTLSVSHFRLPLLKKIVPTALLAGFDSLLQGSGRWLQVAPSVFIHSLAPHINPPAPPGAFFACPHCQTPLETVKEEHLICSNPACGRAWSFAGGLYDFKEQANLPS